MNRTIAAQFSMTAFLRAWLKASCPSLSFCMGWISSGERPSSFSLLKIHHVSFFDMSRWVQERFWFLALLKALYLFRLVWSLDSWLFVCIHASFAWLFPLHWPNFFWLPSETAFPWLTVYRTVLELWRIETTSQGQSDAETWRLSDILLCRLRCQMPKYRWWSEWAGKGRASSACLWLRRRMRRITESVQAVFLWCRESRLRRLPIFTWLRMRTAE